MYNSISSLNNLGESFRYLNFKLFYIVTLWEFHTCIDDIWLYLFPFTLLDSRLFLISSNMSYSQFMSSFFFSKKPLSPVKVIHMCMGLELVTGAWVLCHQLLITYFKKSKTNFLSFTEPDMVLGSSSVLVNTMAPCVVPAPQVGMAPEVACPSDSNMATTGVPEARDPCGLWGQQRP